MQCVSRVESATTSTNRWAPPDPGELTLRRAARPVVELVTSGQVATGGSDRRTW
jgi:hypothetical protein